MTVIVEDNYAYCVGGNVFLVCQRCGALVCGEDASVNLHESFHDELVRSGVGMKRREIVNVH